MGGHYIEVYVHVGGIGTDFNTFVHPEKIRLGNGLKGVILGKGKSTASFSKMQFIRILSAPQDSLLSALHCYVHL